MHQGLNDWVEEIARLTKPDRVVWCDGSDEENERLIAEQLESGSLQRLDEAEFPNSFLARSDPNDVARVEHLTFICCEKEADAGPTNNWMSPEEAESRVKPNAASCETKETRGTVQLTTLGMRTGVER